MTREALTVFLMTAFCAVAQVGGGVVARGLEGVDREFVLRASQSGRADVELAVLAERKAVSDKVRALAAAIRTDRERANLELLAIANRKGLSLRVRVAEKEKYDEPRMHLEQLDGVAFDRAYAEAMLQEHQADVQAFERFEQDAKDNELKAFASRTLPILRKDLSLAEAASNDTFSR
jgi:putative membrane protein